VGDKGFVRLAGARINSTIALLLFDFTLRGIS
jgi:hypothetical protein